MTKKPTYEKEIREKEIYRDKAYIKYKQINAKDLTNYNETHIEVADDTSDKAFTTFRKIKEIEKS